MTGGKALAKDTHDLMLEDIVVRRKRKRHTLRSFCCCREPDSAFLENLTSCYSTSSLATPKSGPPFIDFDILLQFSPRPDIDGGRSADAQEPRFTMSETQLPLSDGQSQVEYLGNDTENMVTADFEQPIASPATPGIESDALAAVSASCKVEGRRTRGHIRKHPVEQPTEVEAATPSPSSDGLLQAVGGDGDSRIPLLMENVTRFSTPEKPRKWNRVDPRKISVPFRSSTFRAMRERRNVMTTTPSSYASQGFTTSVATAPRYTEVDGQGLDSPSPRRSSRRQKRVRFCESAKLELVPVVTNKKSNSGRKSSARIAPPRSSVKASAGGEPLRKHDSPGPRPLAMFPVSIGSYSKKMSSVQVQVGATRDGSATQCTTPSPTRLPRSSISEPTSSPDSFSTDEDDIQGTSERRPRPAEESHKSTLKAIGSLLDGLCKSGE